MKFGSEIPSFVNAGRKVALCQYLIKHSSPAGDPRAECYLPGTAIQPKALSWRQRRRAAPSAGAYCGTPRRCKEAAGGTLCDEGWWAGWVRKRSGAGEDSRAPLDPETCRATASPQAARSAPNQACPQPGAAHPMAKIPGVVMPVRCGALGGITWGGGHAARPFPLTQLGYTRPRHPLRPAQLQAAAEEAVLPPAAAAEVMGAASPPAAGAWGLGSAETAPPAPSLLSPLSPSRPRRRWVALPPPPPRNARRRRRVPGGTRSAGHGVPEGAGWRAAARWGERRGGSPRMPTASGRPPSPPVRHPLSPARGGGSASAMGCYRGGAARPGSAAAERQGLRGSGSRLAAGRR